MDFKDCSGGLLPKFKSTRTFPCCFPSGLFVFVSVFVGYGHGGPVGQVVGVDVGGGKGAVALAVEEGVALVSK